MSDNPTPPRLEDITHRDPAGQTPPAPSASRKSRKPKVTVESVAQLIEFAYQKKGKPVPLGKPLAKRLGDALQIGDLERERLLDVARNDLPLAVARQLLVTAIGIPATNKLREVLRGFVRDVLLMHPAFAAEELQAFVRNLPDAIDPARAVELVLDANYPLEEAVEGKKGGTAAVVGKRRRSVGSCLAVWLVVTKRMPPEIVLKLLYPTVWKLEAAKVKGEERRVSRLLDLADPARVALVCSVYEELLDEEVARADTAARNSESEARKASQLSSALEKAKGQIASHVVRIEELERLIEEERKKSHIAMLHHRDDYEKLRGRVLRRLKSETTLLDEGLQALRRDPPKVHVMLDHADRAIGGLKSEIRNLESEGKR